jgi:cleavage and polyadenylation specificity factor subunit 3
MNLVQDMFGEDSVPKIFQGDRIYVSVDNKRANIHLSELKVNTYLPTYSHTQCSLRGI